MADEKLCNHFGVTRRSPKLGGKEMAEFDGPPQRGMGGAPQNRSLAWGPSSTGIDKYFNKLTDWGMYLSPIVFKNYVGQQAATNVSCAAFGVVEIIAGA